MAVNGSTAGGNLSHPLEEPIDGIVAVEVHWGWTDKDVLFIGLARWLDNRETPFDCQED